MIKEPSAIRVLLVEDNPFDAELIEHQIRGAGLDASFIRVEDRPGFVAALQPRPDVVLIDYNLPAFDVFSAMEIVAEHKEAIPFIVVTGYSGDEVAAECIKRGAVDYVLKDQVRRLPQAVMHALEQHELRQQARQAQSEIFASEALKSAILQSALDCIVGIDDQGVVIEFNPAAESTFGYSKAEALGKEVAELIIPPRYRERHRAGLSRFRRTQESRVLGERIEIEAMRKDGSTFPVELAITEVNLPDKKVFTAVIRDISTRQEMERSLRESEERFRSLVQNSRDVIAVIDDESVCVYVSPAVETMTGFAPEEVMGHPGLSFIHPDDAAVLAMEFEEIKAEPNLTRTVETRLRTKSGEYIWIEIRAANRLHDPSIQGIVLNYHDVTQRKVAEDQVRRSQQSLADAQAISRIGSFKLDRNLRAIELSDEQYRIFGHSPGSITPTYENFIDAIHPDARADVDAATQGCLRTGEPCEYEVRVRGADGDERWIHARVYATVEDGRVVGLHGTNQDVTERRAAEQERLRLVERERELDEQSRLLLESTGEGVWGLDQEGRCTFVNSAAAKLLGYEPEQLLGQYIHALAHHSRPDGSPYPVEECPTHSAIQTGVGTTSASEVFWRADGTSVPVEYSAFPIFKNGQPSGAVVSFKDVSERLRIEAALSSSEALFRGAFNAAQMGIALIAADERTYVDVNQAFCDMIGYTKEEISRLTWLDITHPDDREANLKQVERLASGKDEVSFLTKRYVRKDGTVITVEISDGLVRDSEGALLYFVTHAVDVTDRIQAAQTLRESQELLQGVIDNSPAMIYVRKADGRFLLANERFGQNFAVPALSVLDNEIQQLMPDEVAAAFDSLDQRVLRELKPLEVEERIPTAGGEMRTYLSVRFPLVDAEGNAYAVCGISTDISERVDAEEERIQLEAQLRQALKMEAVGQLAGGIAHDFNNILAVILNYAAFAAEDLDPADTRTDDLNEIIKAGNKATKLIHQLLAFSRKEVVEEEVVVLNDVITDIRELLTRSIGEDVTLVTDLQPDLAATKADASQLEQVLVNLSVNARDAMPEGGTLTIATGLNEVHEGDLPGLAAGSYVTLRVSDTGTGMSAETADRIFEPFFTTKGRGEGTGLGLATVYGVVKRAQGGVYVESELDRGTSFTVYLPTCVDEPEEVRPTLPAPARGGEETILVVEDDDAVRNLVARILKNGGFDVVAMSSGVAAVDYCRVHDTPVHLLLTDVVMPQMSGRKVADSILEMKPQTKILFMSGYTDEIIAKRGVLEEGQNLINKPFDGGQLITRVREVLTEGAPR